LFKYFVERSKVNKMVGSSVVTAEIGKDFKPFAQFIDKKMIVSQRKTKVIHK